MAAGDAFIVTGSISGSSSVTITVPTGAEVVVSGAGVRDPGNTSLGFDDGSNISAQAHYNVPTDGHGLQTRPVYDDSTAPRLVNQSCSSKSFHISGREF